MSAGVKRSNRAKTVHQSGGSRKQQFYLKIQHLLALPSAEAASQENDWDDHKSNKLHLTNLRDLLLALMPPAEMWRTKPVYRTVKCACVTNGDFSKTYSHAYPSLTFVCLLLTNPYMNVVLHSPPYHSLYSLLFYQYVTCLTCITLYAAKPTTFTLLFSSASLKSLLLCVMATSQPLWCHRGSADMPQGQRRWSSVIFRHKCSCRMCLKIFVHIRERTKAAIPNPRATDRYCTVELTMEFLKILYSDQFSSPCTCFP